MVLKVAVADFMQTNILHHYSVDKVEWESAVQQFPEANFLQSWNWGVFQERLGKSVVRFITKSQTETGSLVVGVCQAVFEKARRGAYLAVAGGPLSNWEGQEEVLHVQLNELKRIAKELGCSFIRLRPQQVDSPQIQTVVRRCGMSRSPMHLTADLTLQLDLTQSTDVLLQEMRKNTRAAIRKATELGITVRQSNDVTEIEEFYLQQKSLAKRHGFVPFSRMFLEEQFRSFMDDGQVVLFHAYSGDVLLASAFIIFYNHEAVYHYGVSTLENAKLPGSYACQWAAIRAAQQLGCTRYNFWGIAPEAEKQHRFAGVSLFKRGFGGREVAYLPAHDIPLSWRYGLTYLFERLRSKYRKLE
ncbi:peptidoglycan bridge formation glycyltransferase FemA/FemB family protein [Candidatus Woesebacteria bacterium]|nr:peptidoglycan bridge formation glycyltransferase FemA/FemB family protein [Candidatus Woesebacteria bacterium]